MAPIDWILLFLLVAFVADGVWRGLLRETASFLGLIVGLVVATLFYRPLGRLLGGLVPSTLALAPLAWVVLMLSCWIVANLLGLAARRHSADRGESWDALGGGIVGLLTGVIVLGALLDGALALGLPFAREARSALLGAWLLRLFASLGRLIS